MKFEEFEYIINKIKESDEKRRKISKFFEEELATSSFIYFTFGEELSSLLISILADYYSCWWTPDGKREKSYKESFTESNDISWWLYEDVDKVIYRKGDAEIDVNDIKDFFTYLESNK